MNAAIVRPARIKRIMVLARDRLLWSLLMFGSLNALASTPDLKVGDTPPDIFGKSSTGDVVRLTAYRGRIVVISFWASWCGPCRKELPMLMNLQKQGTRDKVVVLSVNWRQSYQEFHEIKKIFKNAGTEVTLVSDEHGRAGDAYGVKAIPHMIIVGRDGTIAAIHVGYNEQEIPVLVDEINSTWAKTTAEGSIRN